MSLETYAHKYANAKDRNHEAFYALCLRAFSVSGQLRRHFSFVTSAIEERKRQLVSVEGSRPLWRLAMREIDRNAFEAEYVPALSQGLFLSLYAFGIDTLRNLCHVFYPVMKTEWRLEDLRGGEVAQVALFLTKALEVELPAFFTSNSEGQYLGWARNKLIHQNGRLGETEVSALIEMNARLRDFDTKSNSDEFRKALADASWIEEDYDGEKILKIGLTFAEMAHVLIHGMFVKLFASCEARMKQLTASM